MPNSSIPKRIVAIADIGSNTSLLLIASLSKAQKVKVLEDRLFYTRLAEGFAQAGEQKYIKTTALKRQAHFFETAQKLIRPYLPSIAIKCVATAASRQARNKDQLISLGKQYGFQVEVISAKKEAQLSRVGALFKLPLDPKQAVVLDIGGASTEISSERNYFSLPIGSVNLTEGFLSHNPPTPLEIHKMEKYMKQEVQKIPFSFAKENKVLVATAGTPTTLANLQNPSDRLKNGFPEGHGTKLSLQQVEKWSKHLLLLPFEERKKLKGMPIYRADVLPAGVYLLKYIMHFFHYQQCIVSVTGLRYGLLNHFKDHSPYKNSL